MLLIGNLLCFLLFLGGCDVLLMVHGCDQLLERLEWLIPQELMWNIEKPCYGSKFYFHGCHKKELFARKNALKKVQPCINHVERQMPSDQTRISLPASLGDQLASQIWPCTSSQSDWVVSSLVSLTDRWIPFAPGKVGIDAGHSSILYPLYPLHPTA